MNASHKQYLNEIVKFVASQLELNALPQKVIIVNDPNFIKTQLSFGVYSTDTDEIRVYTSGRHIVDVCRTLCHELVHHKQREMNTPADGSDGSFMENEANALAGVLMRKFRYLHPEIYSEI